MLLQEQIFKTSSKTFETLALEVFRFQFENNSVYRSFCDLLYKHPANIHHLEEIPFLPISMFKTKKVLVSGTTPEIIFQSSGTTGTTTSKHYIADVSLYKKSFTNYFQKVYGNPQDYVILGLLPSYLERKDASLVYMVDSLITSSKHPESGFYLKQYDKLAETLKILEQRQQKTLLLGVSFALLEFAETHPKPLQNTIVMETGGMKGKRKEVIRDELHTFLKEAFQVSTIHSEYGMTELLSQAYAKKDGVFHSPPWMRILIRDTEDPFAVNTSQTGGINVIDLANLHSCSFIATDDLGKAYENNTFEVLGRFDASDIRGCNLMAL